MAIVRNSKSVKDKNMLLKKSLTASRKKLDEDFELPTEVEEPSGELDDFAILIAGEKKIGKTRTSLEPDPKKILMLQFDPAQIAYRRLEVVCDSFKKFLKALRKLEKLAQINKFPYKRIVIDRADIWFKHAETQIKEEMLIENLADAPYASAYSSLDALFTDAVDRVLKLPCGKWFLCHSTWKEVETRSGEKIQKLLPNLPGRAESIFKCNCDIVKL
jgi:hypothetical protein